jgi:hypothetical protein
MFSLGEGARDIFEDCIDFERVFGVSRGEVVAVLVGGHDGVGVGEFHPDGVAQAIGDAADDEAVEDVHFGAAGAAFAAETASAQEGALGFLLAALLAGVVETEYEAVPFGFLGVLGVVG